MPERPLTLMAVHAHPDDEAISTGGILARYSAEGVRTVLVTCTNGELGDAPGGIKPGEPGHDEAVVVPLRRKELEASCDVLGVTNLELLGYHDSGMEGWPQNDAPDSFWQTPVAVAGSRLAALMRTFEPQVVVTYDENGFYGHPDHIQANRVTHAAIAECGIPAKLYYTAIARSRLHGFRDVMAEAGVELPEEVQENPDFGTPDELITTTVDCSALHRAEVRVARRAREPERQHLLPEDGRGRVRPHHGPRELRAGAGLDRGAGARGRPVRRAPLTFQPGTRRPEPSRACAPPGRGDAGPGPVWSLRRGAGRGGAGASVGNRSDEAQRGGGDEHHRGEQLDSEGLLGEGGQPRVLESEQPDRHRQEEAGDGADGEPDPDHAPPRAGGRPRCRCR